MRELLTEQRIRLCAAGLGLGLLVFGAIPVIAPKPFASVFGFDEPTAETAAMSRSVGARDVAMGAGLWSAAAHGGNYAPWLLARMLSDGGDVLAIGIAAAQGKRNPRFLSLGGLALVATLADAALWALTRQARE